MFFRRDLFPKLVVMCAVLVLMGVLMEKPQDNPVDIAPISRNTLLFTGNGQGSTFDLWLFDLDSRELQNITQTLLQFERNAIWSPDGERIVYSLCKQLGPGYTTSRCELYQQKLGEQPEQITSDSYRPDYINDVGALMPSWSSDGSSMTYMVDHAGTGHQSIYDRYEIDMQTRQSRKLSQPWSGHLNEYRPNGYRFWSPDDSRYAYIVNTGATIGDVGVTDLYIAQEDAEAEKVLHFEGMIYGLAWRP